MSILVFCSHCQDQVHGFAEQCRICCPQCGKVLDTDYLVEETTFAKDKFGQSQVCGNYVKSSRSESSRDVSREYRLEKAEQELRCMKNALEMGENEEIVDMAKRLYKIAVEQNFTRGRKTDQVLASCLYIACREKRKPYLLIDFSNYLSINVYVLGAVFLQLCKVLMLDQHLNYQPVDPSWFIHKFTESLPGGKNKWVIQTAQRIITSMKRDWMQTGRKPSGLCGAALYISAHAHGLKCSKADIMRIVHVCDATLTKRLVEFENTESGSLTVEEFLVKAKELEELSEEPNLAVRVDVKNDILCKHKDSGKPFAYGLCKTCYDDCMQISGGLGGGSNPPAFQHAEIKRSEKVSAEQNTNDPDVDSRPCQSIDNSKESSDVTNLEKELNKSEVETGCGRLQFMEPESGGDDTANTAIDIGAKTVGVGTEAADESDNLSDIDDAEVDFYLLNEEAKRHKTMVWEEVNRDYIEEQAAKAAGTNCSEDAKKLEQTKRRKEKQQAREAEARNLTPAQTPAEAVGRELKKKRINFNPEPLGNMFEADDPHNSKKRKIESHMDTDVKELDGLGPENEEMGIEDEEGIAGTFGYSLDYPDVDEEFYGEDYDYDEY